MKTLPLDFPTPLTEKYRPKHVADFIGLLKPKRILLSYLKRPYDSAWLFLGPSGLGKTTIAMALGEDMNAEITQIASKSCDLDTVRDTFNLCQMKAFNFKTGVASSRHCVIINEADGMTDAAQRSLLSKLDATAAPPDTTIIFTANSKLTLEPRFLSRCRELEFTHDSVEGELAHYLRMIYKKEGGKYPLDFEAMAKASQFNVRDAVTKLELELMLGEDRDDLPSEDLKIVDAHTHSCIKNCGKPWKHMDPNCLLPFRTVCPTCGGASSVGSLRARKAIETMRTNAIKKHEEEKKAKKKGKVA